MTANLTKRIRRISTSGFTLLEVMVALAITGVVLSSLFSLLGGSKQLTWQSQDSLTRATELRAVTNFALLQNEFVEVEPILEGRSYRITVGPELEPPLRKTQPMVHALQSFVVVHEQREEEVSGSRWIQLELPQ
ncbi:MAG: type II secretion system protein [Gammaproteobacteria bacterium]|nr:type II secretion system protein [Gammaproteobacteria bacterium]